MNKKQLEEIKTAGAWSFPELNPPAEAVYLGSEEKKGDVYHYWKLKDKYLFENETGHAFKVRMDNFEKEQRKKRWRRKAGLHN